MVVISLKKAVIGSVLAILGLLTLIAVVTALR